MLHEPPGITVPRLLQRTGLSLGDIDVVEMHEAFGAQVACNLAAWEQGWKLPAIGAVPTERLNPLGSSIAIGHPFAATGIRPKFHEKLLAAGIDLPAELFDSVVEVTP